MLKSSTPGLSIPQIQVELSPKKKEIPPIDKLGFGQFFSDHQFVAKYTEGKGWYEAKIEPLQPLPLHPAASVLHYGQALFEGMKAFRQKSGQIVLFRPEYNAKRMQQGAERLCMEAPPTELFIEAVKELVKVDSRWVPETKGSSLYIRPTLIGTEGFLGVRPAREFMFFIILSPVASYFKSSSGTVKIWVENEATRAAPGGLGATKAAANYAASLQAALKAKEHGYSQVLWLDVNREYIEEVGTMNVFFVIGNEVVTPNLSGTILAGGVRDSVLHILRQKGYKVSERRLAIEEVAKAHDQGQLKEVFGTGTAAIISPVGELFYKGRSLKIGSESEPMGPIAQQVYNELAAIQYGEKEDPYNWLFPIK